MRARLAAYRATTHQLFNRSIAYVRWLLLQIVTWLGIVLQQNLRVALAILLFPFNVLLFPVRHAFVLHLIL